MHHKDNHFTVPLVTKRHESRWKVVRELLPKLALQSKNGILSPLKVTVPPKNCAQLPPISWRVFVRDSDWASTPQSSTMKIGVELKTKRTGRSDSTFTTWWKDWKWRKQKVPFTFFFFFNQTSVWKLKAYSASVRYDCDHCGQILCINHWNVTVDQTECFIWYFKWNFSCTFIELDHFRVPLNPSFKKSPSAKLLLW